MSYDETGPCPNCGEPHGRTPAEVYFAEECERRGLPADVALVPDKVKDVIGTVSEMIGLLSITLVAEPGLMQYYAAALAAASRVAEDHSGIAFGVITEMVFGKDGPTAPNRED